MPFTAEQIVAPAGYIWAADAGRFPIKISGFDRYSAAPAREATMAYVDIAHRYRIDPAQMAIAYVCGREFCATTIIGATSLEQLEADIDACRLELLPELLQEIDEIHRRWPNPAP